MKGYQVQGGVGGNGDLLFNGYGISVGVIEKVWK